LKALIQSIIFVIFGSQFQHFSVTLRCDFMSKTMCISESFVTIGVASEYRRNWESFTTHASGGRISSQMNNSGTFIYAQKGFLGIVCNERCETKIL